MAPVVPDPRRIKAFASAAAFEKWLAQNHDRAPEIWIKFHKRASGLKSISFTEALDVALCWGWIDGIRKGFDERSFLQRYTPRRAKSRWSQINREHVARLIAAGRMTKHGLRVVEDAKADGRWDAAYAPISATTPASVPRDLRAAIEKNSRAKRAFGNLSKQELFSLTFHVSSMKTASGRARKIETLVAKLARGDALVPGARPRKPVRKARALRQ